MRLAKNNPFNSASFFQERTTKLNIKEGLSPSRRQHVVCLDSHWDQVCYLSKFSPCWFEHPDALYLHSSHHETCVYQQWCVKNGTTPSWRLMWILREEDFFGRMPFNYILVVQESQIKHGSPSFLPLCFSPAEQQKETSNCSVCDPPQEIDVRWTHISMECCWWTPCCSCTVVGQTSWMARE